MRPAVQRPPPPTPSSTAPLVPAKSQERLLPASSYYRNTHSFNLDDVKSNSDIQEMSVPSSPERNPPPPMDTPETYRTYKRRWFGLVQLVLLNAVVSWNVYASSYTKDQFLVARSSDMTVVVGLLCRLFHRSAFLQCHRVLHQLAQYWFFVCLCCRQPVSFRPFANHRSEALIDLYSVSLYSFSTRARSLPY
jgi:hypothetical protein